MFFAETGTVARAPRAFVSYVPATALGRAGARSVFGVARSVLSATGSWHAQATTRAKPQQCDVQGTAPTRAAALSDEAGSFAIP